MKNYVITVARGFGSGGKEISLKLAQKLGIPCYYSQLLEMASEQSGLNKSLFVKSDERLTGSALIRAIKGKPNHDAVIEPTERDFVSDVNLFNIQSGIIRELAKTQSCIIIGKCANDVLLDFDNVVSVYIEAPRRFCEKRVMEDFGCTKAEAGRMIHHTDKYRADYYRYYTGGKSWTDPVAYDLTLNSERVGIEGCVNLIAHYVEQKFSQE